MIGGDNLPSPVAKGLTDLPNIGGASGPPGPPPVPAPLLYTAEIFSPQKLNFYIVIFKKSTTLKIITKSSLLNARVYPLFDNTKYVRTNRSLQKR